MLTVILFWYFVKYIAFIAVGYTVFLLLIQMLSGRLSGYLRSVLIDHSVHFFELFIYFCRTKVLKITDERSKLMSEIFKSMRTVKMYCWETLFEKKIRSIRK